MTIPEVKTKTLAMASRANSKLARKTTEQLDKLLQVQQLEPISTLAPQAINTPRQVPHDASRHSTREQELEADNEQRLARLQRAETMYLARIRQEPHNPLWQRQLSAMMSHMERRENARGNPTRIEQIN
ncbi:hypothetical protein CKAH01_18471 [Colletotrichum kahawae]|uniref:Uncharacterized protein n=1 Tax=Colletotrichum kahawae TaxID=34407 RepID=A0AAD9Y7R7_COLKA|nr:hypothetical protein CKAH01_18471 [Colletotrichum kahawae]